MIIAGHKSSRSSLSPSPARSSSEHPVRNDSKRALGDEIAMRSIFAIKYIYFWGGGILSCKMRFYIAGLPLSLRVLAAQLGRRELDGLCEIPLRLARSFSRSNLGFPWRTLKSATDSERVERGRERKREARETRRENCSEEMRHSALCPRDPNLFFRIRYCDYYYMITI